MPKAWPVSTASHSNASGSGFLSVRLPLLEYATAPSHFTHSPSSWRIIGGFPCSCRHHWRSTLRPEKSVRNLWGGTSAAWSICFTSCGVAASLAVALGYAGTEATAMRLRVSPRNWGSFSLSCLTRSGYPVNSMRPRPARSEGSVFRSRLEKITMPLIPLPTASPNSIATFAFRPRKSNRQASDDRICWQILQSCC
jgi:hypothetical protein